MNWLVVTEESPFGGALAALRNAGAPVTAVAVGKRQLADALASSGVSRVLWVEQDGAVESAGPVLQTAAAAEKPDLVVTTSAPGARSLASSIAATLKATVLPNISKVSEADGTVLEQLVVQGAAIETLSVRKPVVVSFGGEDQDVPASEAVEIETLSGPTAPITSEPIDEATSGGGLGNAATVVSIGRGVSKKEDLELVEELAAVLGAEIGCSMPVADDLGWIEKDHYVGRSGQRISPRLYVAIGISGAPQHMEGVRGAKVVAAVNSDPDAPIFRTADFGIVGDLYEVIPQLINQLKS